MYTLPILPTCTLYTHYHTLPVLSLLSSTIFSLLFNITDGTFQSLDTLHSYRFDICIYLYTIFDHMQPETLPLIDRLYTQVLQAAGS